MPQSVSYLILRCRTELYQPGIKFNLQPGASPTQAAADVAATLLVELLTLETTITFWEGYTATGAQTGGGVINEYGLVSTNYIDVTYAMFLVLASTSPTKRPSSQYIQAFPAEFANNGVLSTVGVAAMSAYSSGMVSAGFRDSEGSTLTGVGFGHFSRRHNLETVI